MDTHETDKTPNKNGYAGAGHRRCRRTPATRRPKARAKPGRAILVGLLGGVASAVGYMIYSRLPDDQKDRLHTTVRGAVESRINEISPTLTFKTVRSTDAQEAPIRLVEEESVPRGGSGEQRGLRGLVRRVRLGSACSPGPGPRAVRAAARRRSGQRERHGRRGAGRIRAQGRRGAGCSAASGLGLA